MRKKKKLTIEDKAYKIVNHYGVALQAMKMQEELGELQTELARLLLQAQDVDAKGSILNFIEEMSDVKLMILQMEIALGMEDIVAFTMNEKADRTLGRMRKEKHSDNEK